MATEIRTAGGTAMVSLGDLATQSAKCLQLPDCLHPLGDGVEAESIYCRFAT